MQWWLFTYQEPSFHSEAVSSFGETE